MFPLLETFPPLGAALCLFSPKVRAAGSFGPCFPVAGRRWHRSRPEAEHVFWKLQSPFSPLWSHLTKLIIRVIPSVKSRYEHWRGFFPLLLKNRALVSMKKEQEEAGLRDQIWNIAPSPLPSLMVIQAHGKKVRHRSGTTVISQTRPKGGSLPTLAQETLPCPRELAGHHATPTGNSCHRGREGGNFPC